MTYPEHEKKNLEDGYMALLHHRGTLHLLLEQIADEKFDSRDLVKSPEITTPQFNVKQLDPNLFTGESYRQLSAMVDCVKEMPREMQIMYRSSYLDIVVAFNVASNINSLGFDPAIAMQFLISGLMFCCHFDYESEKWMDKETYKLAFDKMIETIQQSRMEQTAFEELNDLLK